MGSLADVALALYRKYRPAKFAEVVGQEHVTDPLRTALESGRINHAYLFSGPRGCGKTSSARILARSLNCEQGPTPEPCGVCSSCVSLAPGGPGNIDVTELDAASHGGVDDTRELRDRAFFAPAESRYRVFIVDEAHMITTQGFNALLKIVEEPPEHLVFVFATTEPEKVLPTIRSRTHHYPFRLIPPGTLRKLLERICAEEGVAVAPAVYPLVIRAGGGSARDSLSVLDQLVSGAGPEGVTYDRAVALLGVTDVSLIDDVVDALAAGDRAAVFEAIDRLVEAGHDPRRFATDLLQRLRDLTLLQAVPEAVGRGIVEAADDEVRRMVEQSGKFGAATLTRYGEILHTGLTEMRGATAPRLLLELLCARMLLPAATTAEPGLLERLERLERRSDIASGPPAPGEAGDDTGHGRQFDRPSTRASGAPTGAGAGSTTSARGGPDERGGEPLVVSREPAAAAEHGGLVVLTRESGVAAAAGGAAAAGNAPGLVAGPGGPGLAGAGRREPATAAGGRAVPEVTPAGRSRPEVAAAGGSSSEVAAARGGEVDSGAAAGGGRDLSAGGSVAQPPSGALTDPAEAAGRTSPAGPATGETGGGAPERSDRGGATAVGAADVRRVWQEIQDAVKQRKKRTAALLVSATVRAVEHDTLVLSIGTAPLARLLAEQSNTDVIAEALHAVLGVRWRVRCEHGDAPVPPPSARGAAEPRSAANPPPPAPAPTRQPPGDAVSAAAATVGSPATGAGSASAGPTSAGLAEGGGASDVAVESAPAAGSSGGALGSGTGVNGSDPGGSSGTASGSAEFAGASLPSVMAAGGISTGAAAGSVGGDVTSDRAAPVDPAPRAVSGDSAAGAADAAGGGSAVEPAGVRSDGSATAGGVMDVASPGGSSSTGATPRQTSSGQAPAVGAATETATLSVAPGRAAPGGATTGSARPGRAAASSRPQFQRPSTRAGARPAVVEAVPLPPEPPDEDAPPDDEEAMLAELDAGTDGQASGEQAPVVSDPEAAAIALLTTQLGARAINPR
jgi:DNA polymerase-3 subunit gamma/tau